MKVKKDQKNFVNQVEQILGIQSSGDERDLSKPRSDIITRCDHMTTPTPAAAF